MRKNILLNISVKKTSDYFGDWRSAIDEAYSLAKELNIGCALNYVNQYQFTILPTMTQEEIDQLKNKRVVIGV